MTAPSRQHTDTGNLWRWVDRLTAPQRHRLVRRTTGQPPRVQHVSIPSLWQQLAEAQASTNSGGGHGKARPGSRAPLDLTITALLADITSHTVDELVARGQQLRWRPDDRGYGVRLLDTHSSIRQLAATIVGTADQDLVDRWARRMQRWVHQAELALGTDPEGDVDTRQVRGHACPACRALWVTWDRDGDTFRSPALTVAFREGRVLYVTCGSCGAGWWRGDDVDQLTKAIEQDAELRGDPRHWGLTVPRRQA